MLRRDRVGQLLTALAARAAAPALTPAPVVAAPRFAEPPSETARVAAALQRVFAEFNVDAAVIRAVRGPAVTRYEIKLGPGVRVEAVTKLSDNVALALGTDRLRVIPVVAGRTVMGIEVPNTHRDDVRLSTILANVDSDHPLLVVLGADVTGHPVIVNLQHMPHLLVAGATGTGKSVFLNSLLAGLLSRATPRRLRLLLIDPKRVELTAYADVPHLVAPVVVNPRHAPAALDWLVREMDLRYDVLAAARVRNIDEYNAGIAAGRLRGEPYPYLVAVVDELADLMMVAADEVEESIVRLAQLARAAGIHLVLATQRPSVDVVTGLIKANMPARLAFTTASGIDSQVILDQRGAEKLLGKGDALFLSPGTGAPIRVQGAFVTDDEINEVVSVARTLGVADHVPVEAMTRPADAVQAEVVNGDDDLLREAAELVIASGSASTSMLQRKMRIGYAKAGRLIDQLEKRGVVGPATGTTRPRAVLVDELPG